MHVVVIWNLIRYCLYIYIYMRCTNPECPASAPGSFAESCCIGGSSEPARTMTAFHAEKKASAWVQQQLSTVKMRLQSENDLMPSAGSSASSGPIAREDPSRARSSWRSTMRTTQASGCIWCVCVYVLVYIFCSCRCGCIHVYVHRS